MDEKETGRLEAFSDGVFAVAITLLILNIKIPGFDDTSTPTDSMIRDALKRELPVIAAYIISFGTIGVMWLNHRTYCAFAELSLGIRTTSTPCYYFVWGDILFCRLLF